ncbi:MAG: nickel pincer cofactor biosynthesis protein LarB [Acidimicrobiia bacterium]|nr:nickel pincer cofactor biosynthesis protein LarB [Acidimicrobiia bacterium]MYC57572.1 nickel pincer cofactor biosynthesis protein LarB [Acidimicrobiia bacterium]MYG94862.1 nickel pincer cofactor biosynthesis protein LarB [Acidimicrobiia bacterium]MYI30064.1 nickel pincer cofactor biosynthesis protein LarB [Acidimicrobiia bacterium]
MDEALIHQLLEDVRLGTLTPDDALLQLRVLPFVDLGFARVDHHRKLRQGFGEVVYGPGKSPDQCAAIVAELLSQPTGPVLLTRATSEQVVVALERNVDGNKYEHVRGWHTVVWRRADERFERVVLAVAGTADLPVADECAAVLIAHGLTPTRLNDVGVAGLHRLLTEIETLLVADVVVVVAGMEGALGSVVGGLTSAPVIAVPTSVGYGSSLEGVTALLAMLSSCAAGVTVVGIDNGFGAGCAVLRLLLKQQQTTLVSGVANG